MRHIQRSITAVLFIFVLAVPAEASGRRSSRPAAIVESVQRFVVLIMSRISPPGSAPVLAPDEPLSKTTDAPAKTQRL